MRPLIDIKVPDIGDHKDVPIIELLVGVGDRVELGDTIAVLESDKATMDVPSSATGVVRELLVKLGDRVGEGVALIRAESETLETGCEPSTEAQAEMPVRQLVAPAPAASAQRTERPVRGSKAQASPSVRRVARELGVDLSRVPPSERKGRITKDDVIAHVKATMQASIAQTPPPAQAAAAGVFLELPPWPSVDFARFGPVERRPRGRIQKISAANLHRNWVMMPHVTNFDEADVTELEVFRRQINAGQGTTGARLTMLAFLIKASVHALQAYPVFNSSLEGDEVVEKRYWHIGFATETPNGLVVPVIRDAERKRVVDIAAECVDLARLARAGTLKPEQMQGGTFTISSLGGIGGTGFTPIINAPEVAILGVTRSRVRPVWNNGQFVPRTLLPLCLSWDHRAVDGAAAAHFLVHLAKLLGDSVAWRSN